MRARRYKDGMLCLIATVISLGAACGGTGGVPCNASPDLPVAVGFQGVIARYERVSDVIGPLGPSCTIFPTKLLAGNTDRLLETDTDFFRFLAQNPDAAETWSPETIGGLAASHPLDTGPAFACMEISSTAECGTFVVDEGLTAYAGVGGNYYVGGYNLYLQDWLGGAIPLAVSIHTAASELAAPEEALADRLDVDGGSP